MSLYLVFILAFLVLGSAWSIFLELLNLTGLSPSAPPQLADVHDPQRYKRSQEYTRTLAKFSIITESLSCPALILFILGGGFSLADHVTRLSGNEILNGMTFFALLFGISELAGLPFSIYRTFVIERRFGFNTTTPWTFFMDRLKGYALAAILGLPLAGAVLWLFDTSGPQAWLWCWVLTTLFSLAMTYLAPTLILPLFNTFTTLEEGELRDTLVNVARQARFHHSGIFVMDGSKRSSKANAFFTGFGATKRIALYDTLLATHNPDEIAAILAHEIGHSTLGHITKGMLISIVQTGILFFLLGQTIMQPDIYKAFGMTAMPVHAGVVFFLLLLSPVTMILTPLFAALSRQHEFAADRFAAGLLPSPQPLISALKKISADSLSNLTPHPWYVAFHYSHPPLIERIAALQRPDASGQMT